jgi:hypothetical protein
MPYDLNVLVINQEKPIHIPFSSRIDVINEIDDHDGKRYHEIYPFMTQTKGVWYSLIKEDDSYRWYGLVNLRIRHLCTDAFFFHFTTLIIEPR